MKNLQAMMVSLFSIALAAVHVRYGIIDGTALLLLVIALVPWLGPFRSSLKLPGVGEIIFRRLEEVEKKVDVIEDGALLPGRPEHGSAGLTALAQQTDDPNKGRFGGSASSNGRSLTARIEEASGTRSAACHVFLSLRSTDPARPLHGVVTFHLHPTFGRWKQYDVPVRDGAATDKLLHGAHSLSVP